MYYFSNDSFSDSFPISLPVLLDKVTMYDIPVVDIDDMQSLITRNIVTVKESQESYLFTRSHEYYSALRLEVPALHFKYSFSLDRRHAGISRLFLTIPHDTNIVGFSANDYRSWLNEIAAYMESFYGITIDIRQAKYLSMEVQRTFTLDDTFASYHRVFNLLFKSFSKQLKLKVSNTMCDLSAESDLPNSYYVSSSNCTIKLYDKKLQQESNRDISVSQNLVRFEITLKNSERIRRFFGTKLVSDMNDVVINQKFHDFVKNMLAKPFYKNRLALRKHLRFLLTRQCDFSSKKWVYKLSHFVLNDEVEKEKPFLLDTNELLCLVNAFRFTPQKKHHIKVRIREHFSNFAPSCCNGDDWRAIEVINKLLNNNSSQLACYFSSISSSNTDIYRIYEELKDNTFSAMEGGEMND